MIKNFLFTTFTAMFMMDSAAQDQIVSYDPPGERHVRILVKNSSITVIGYDSTVVSITAVKIGTPPGTGAATDLKIEERAGVLHITKLSGDEYAYTIRLPRKSRLSVIEEFGKPGQISISKMEAAAEVKSWVSKIILTEVTGPLDLSSQAADIAVQYAAFNDLSASSIITAGRLVEIDLPEKVSASLKLDLVSGKLVSKIDIGAGNIASGLKTGTPRSIIYNLNGGGALLHVTANEIRLQ